MLGATYLTLCSGLLCLHGMGRTVVPQCCAHNCAFDAAALFRGIHCAADIRIEDHASYVTSIRVLTLQAYDLLTYGDGDDATKGCAASARDCALAGS